MWLCIADAESRECFETWHPIEAVQRRAYLSLVASASLAGCSTGYVGPSGEENDGASDRDAVADIVAAGRPSTVCSEEINPDDIRPIVDPAVGTDWDGLDYDAKYGSLASERVVIGLTNGDRARAYPLDVLRYHEAVNGTFGGPVLVTYCSICRSGLVAVRRAGGETAQFAASGLLFQPPGEYADAAAYDDKSFGATTSEPGVEIRNAGNVVLYDDATRSYWSQLLARAICGPLAGQRMEIVPSTVARWGDWRTRHPETDVLLPPPYSTLG